MFEQLEVPENRIRKKKGLIVIQEDKSRSLETDLDWLGWMSPEELAKHNKISGHKFQAVDVWSTEGVDKNHFAWKWAFDEFYSLSNGDSTLLFIETYHAMDLHHHLVCLPDRNYKLFFVSDEGHFEIGFTYQDVQDVIKVNKELTFRDVVFFIFDRMDAIGHEEFEDFLEDSYPDAGIQDYPGAKKEHEKWVEARAKFEEFVGEDLADLLF